MTQDRVSEEDVAPPPFGLSEEIWLAFTQAYARQLSANLQADHPYPHENVMYGALAAIAPRLKAEGLRKAAAMTRKRREEFLAVGMGSSTAGLEGLELAFLQVADTLDPPPQQEEKE